MGKYWLSPCLILFTLIYFTYSFLVTHSYNKIFYFKFFFFFFTLSKINYSKYVFDILTNQTRAKFSLRQEPYPPFETPNQKKSRPEPLMATPTSALLRRSYSRKSLPSSNSTAVLSFFLKEVCISFPQDLRSWSLCYHM